MPNYRPAVPLISNHNIGKTSPRCEMGKHKQQSLNTHKYKTTFTSTTKIALRFSCCFIFSSSSTTPMMSSSALHYAYDTLISLHDKLTRLCSSAVLSQSLIGLRAAMSLALPARRCYQSSRDRCHQTI